MQLLQSLQDIATQVQIKSDFCVSHPNYKVEHPAEVVAQLQQLPQETQAKILSSMLRDFIYDIYYNGSLVGEASEAVMADYSVLGDKTVAGIDWEFCEQLDKSNKGKGFFESGYRVLKQEPDGSLLVEKQGMGTRIHIQPNRHLQLVDQAAVVGDLVVVNVPHNLFQLRCYLAVGDVVGNSKKEYSKVIIFFNFSPEGAVAVMESLTLQLNKFKVPFGFYVLDNPLHFGRYDSGILRVPVDNYELVRTVLQTVYAENKSHFQPQVPLFTKVLAPGLALAEMPKSREDFGSIRCQLIANGLMEARLKGDESKEARMTHILQQFELQGIDLKHPYLDPNSEDIYTPFDESNINLLTI
ncbi:MAG: hypothetical protein KME30_24360 [Iphinoe sp. HA4291-MV1]|jgi:hypothetical protein|nr:hypothetical protein [Iphinoe sp. HA4291-MV1]